MTISSETNKSGPYACNGSTSVFAYTFRILDDDDIAVLVKTTATGVVTTLVKTTNYTVSGVGEASGGNVTLVDPATDAPTGTTLTIVRSISQTQETDYNEYDTFPAQTHEDALDKLTMISQEQQEEIDRSIKIDSAISGFTSTIVGTPTAYYIVRINSGATGYEFVSMSSISAYSFPAGTGLLYQSATDTAITATIAGTANEITVTESPAGTFTFSLPSALTFTGKTITGGTFSGIACTSGLGVTGTLAVTGSITVSGTVDGRDVATDGIKLDGIETGADVTDATNVDAAGAVMNTDTSTSSMSFVIDEDTMSSNSDTKVPTQQSVKAYVDTEVATATGGINPNIIIGGNFSTNPWQRGTSSTSAGSGTFLADRFEWVQSGAGVVDYLKTADAPTMAEAGYYTEHCAQIDVTTADASIGAGDIYLLRYKVEGLDSAQLGFGETSPSQFTLSFWHKHTVTGTYCVSFRNSANDRSYIAEYTQSTTDTWEKATITITADAAGTWLNTNGTGIEIGFALAIGSTYQTTAGSWTAGNYLASSNQVNNMSDTANNSKLALIKLELGDTATTYPIELETNVLERCQRYYVRRTATAANTILLPGGMQSSTNTLAVDFFQVSMRTAPTFSYDGTTTNWYVIINSTTVALTGAPTLVASCLSHGGINVPCSASVGYASWFAAQTSSAWHSWSAEL